LETTKKSSTYLSGYASGFFVVSASFHQNSQNAHDGTIFHHPARGTIMRLPTMPYLSDVRLEYSLSRRVEGDGDHGEGALWCSMGKPQALKRLRRHLVRLVV
jgi:hypothetical protein